MRFLLAFFLILTTLMVHGGCSSDPSTPLLDSKPAEASQRDQGLRDTAERQDAMRPGDLDLLSESMLPDSLRHDRLPNDSLRVDAPPSCKPECKAVGSKSEGWYDGCSGQLIGWSNCANCTSSCQADSAQGKEGWYNSCTHQLIKADTCL
jgi:hypothetical protein